MSVGYCFENIVNNLICASVWNLVLFLCLGIPMILLIIYMNNKSKKVGKVMSLYKTYQCQHCGSIKEIMVNHDQLPELWDRCTYQCMWVSGGEKGPALYSSDGQKTGFNKRRFKRVFSGTDSQ